MVCDIHAHFEIKSTGNWHYYAPADIERNYSLFAKMAGVRNYNQVDPIATPKGLPDDITFMTSLHNDSYGEDGHSHSWFDLNELLCLAKEFNISKFGAVFNVYLFGNSIFFCFEYPDDYPTVIEDIRLVFWFDN